MQVATCEVILLPFWEPIDFIFLKSSNKVDQQQYHEIARYQKRVERFFLYQKIFSA